MELWPPRWIARIRMHFLRLFRSQQIFRNRRFASPSMLAGGKASRHITNLPFSPKDWTRSNGRWPITGTSGWKHRRCEGMEPTTSTQGCKGLDCESYDHSQHIAAH
jgi:hypothetical protein